MPDQHTRIVKSRGIVIGRELYLQVMMWRQAMLTRP